jgi:hypothetical protein
LVQLETQHCLACFLFPFLGVDAIRTENLSSLARYLTSAIKSYYYY